MNRRKRLLLLIPAALALLAAAFVLARVRPWEPPWWERLHDRLEVSDGYPISGVAGTLTEVTEEQFTVAFVRVPGEDTAQLNEMDFPPEPKVDLLEDGVWYRIPDRPVLLPPGSIPLSGVGWEPTGKPLVFRFEELRENLVPGHYRAVIDGVAVEFDVTWWDLL